MSQRILGTATLLLLHLLCWAQGERLNGVTKGGVTMENCRAINSPGVDFGPAIYRRNLIYLTRPRRGAIDPATQMPYFKLFSAKLDDSGLPGKGRRFSVALSGDYNEGPVSFTQEDKVVYFTRTLQRAGGAALSPGGEVNLGIFSAYDDGVDWAAIRPMPHNDPAFTNQHPTLTPDGRRIFFASNRPGGYGGYDLYFADRTGGDWGPAINLGPEINTAGNEAFPFYHASGMLYFSSNGHEGLGGYDVYGISLRERIWGELAALPEPINSTDDDISFVLAADTRSGYLASDRPGGLGKDDVYRITLQQNFESLRSEGAVERTLTAYDATTSKRLAGAYVWVSPRSPGGRLPGGHGYFIATNNTETGTRRVIQQPLPPCSLDSQGAVTTDLRGRFTYAFQPGVRYRISVRKDGYQPLSFEWTEEPGALPPLEVALEPKTNTGGGTTVLPTSPAGDFIDAILPLPEIRYPYLSANPSVEESPDLDVLYAFLAGNPQVSVLLIVHADGPERPETLARLTEERAIRLRRYLKDRGIDGGRIETVAYGDRFPVHPCGDCSKEDYQRNSRIEAKVIAWE